MQLLKTLGIICLIIIRTSEHTNVAISIHPLQNKQNKAVKFT